MDILSLAGVIPPINEQTLCTYKKNLSGLKSHTPFFTKFLLVYNCFQPFPSPKDQYHASSNDISPGRSPSDQNLSCFHLTSRHIELNTEIYQLFIRTMNDDFMNVYQCTMYVELLTMWQKSGGVCCSPSYQRESWGLLEIMQIQLCCSFFHDKLRVRHKTF